MLEITSAHQLRPVTQVEQDGETASYSDLKFVPRKLATPKEDRTELRIASRPCLIPYDLASWAVIKPLPAGSHSPRKQARRARKQKGETNNHERIYII